MAKLSFPRYFMSILVSLLLWFAPINAQAEVFESHFFTVDLGSSWRVSGRPHNMPHSVNVNFVNNNAKSSINIVIGSGQIQPYALLVNLQKTLRSQKAKVGKIEQDGSLLYFEFNLNGLLGFSCSATNGKDVSSITVLGNPQAGKRLLSEIKAKDNQLFPNFQLILPIRKKQPFQTAFFCL